MKNIIFKIVSVVSLSIYTLQAGTPSETASSVYIKQKVIEHDETLTISIGLDDNKFRGVTDANPILVFDGNTTMMKYSMKQHVKQKNFYFFTVEVADPNVYPIQNVNISVAGNYKGEYYIFTTKSATVTFK